MPLLSDPDRRKRNLVIICGLFVVLITATVFALAIRAPAIPVASNILVFALFNLNLIVFLLLLVLLFRNLVKLYFERRQRVVGSRFKTKLVLAFLSLALAPAILIFIVASNFINTSIEGWFKPQVERPLDQALSVAQNYYRNLEITALRQALNLSRAIARGDFAEAETAPALAAFLADRLDLLGLTAVTVFDARGNERASAIDPLLGDLPARDVSPAHVRQGLGGHEVTTVREVEAGDLVQAVVPIWSPAPERQVLGAVAVTIHVSQRLEAKVRAISQSFAEYKQLKLLKNPVKGIYILLFLLLTLIIVFSFSWFGLYVARRITGPIEQLVAATHEVAAGNLNYRVEASADDEVGLLVESFNGMTRDLAQSKTRLEEAYQNLQAKHAELEGRRRYTETVLEAVATGVVSFDREGRLTTMNRAATGMLGLSEPATVGRPLSEVLVARDFQDMVTLVKRGLRRNQTGTIERELRLGRNGTAATLLASATALPGPDGEYAGVVFVLEDLTELLRAQRQAAWREVAQRIAHEIKNPLTPIQLSAQRLQRRLADRSPADRRLLEECTGTIIQEVDGLKHLVNEFSRFARMPAVRPKPTDLRPLVESVLAFYREPPAGVSVTMQVDPEFPLLEVDPDQIKRALLNLVDNAVEALGGAGEVRVDLMWVPDGGHARIIVSDTGTGIAAEDKDKLFVPYFSTKANGMGLGLSIVQQIVSEHGGRIMVDDNRPRGSRFIVELPPALAVEVPPAPVSP
jgi:two-component system, NtrC family, nitrogen regulation sensor histidine kinase NtrY